MRKSFLLGGAIAVLGLSACGDPLNVVNVNNPDVARAYATPAGIEGVIAGLGVQLYNAQHSNEGTNTMSKIMSGESWTTVANFGGAARAAIPRAVIINSLGNNDATGNSTLFNTFSVQSRTASNAVAALDRLIAGGGTLGSVGQNQRARAFGYFILSQALANLASAYDSAAIVTPATGSSDIPELSSYADVTAAAVRMLDSSEAAAVLAAADAGNFTLPTTWISGQSIDRAGFIRLIHSMRARIRVGSVRTVAERAAVDWAKVIADATTGITADFQYDVGGSTGWSGGYHTIQSYVTGGWHQAPMYYYGMADTTGAYSTWLGTSRDARAAFLLETPDLRWPKGNTRAIQTAEAPATVAVPPPRYMRNRPSGEDVPGNGPGATFYDHRRWGFIRVANNTGTLVEMDKTENDMLAAEGYIRAGNWAAAAALIDLSRVPNGLPALTGVVTNGTMAVPGGVGCVPQVPTGPSYTSAACGTMLEAMKYEKRMETAFTGYMQWFRDNRGWGDMVEGTSYHWPVPYQEMQARQHPFYDLPSDIAPSGTYQFGTGNK